jgi:hypothetical protein
MEYNGFRVTVLGGKYETSEGHVAIDHNGKFSLRLHNRHRGPDGCVPCDAEVILNGKPVGTFRVPFGESVTVERPANDTGRFTAYAENSVEAASIGIDRNSNDLGLIEVVFHPGTYKKSIQRVERYDSIPLSYGGMHREVTRGMTSKSIGGARSYGWSGDAISASYCANESMSFDEPLGMGIGLSGRSEQRFTTVEDLDYNESATRIVLRLIKDINCNQARPITPVYSTQTPRKL